MKETAWNNLYAHLKFVTCGSNFRFREVPIANLGKKAVRSDFSVAFFQPYI